MFYHVVNEAVAAFQAVEERADELFCPIARTFKKFHEHLIKAGFSSEEATLIVANQGCRPFCQRIGMAHGP